MIKRPKHLIYFNTKVIFNGRAFNKVEIDLKHINKGRRSKFDENEITQVLLEHINGNFFSSSGFKRFGDESCTYFKIPLRYKNNLWRLVLCICSDKPNTIGIITFFREK